MSLSLFDLTNRVAVVVGGTSGIGHSIALGLAEAGAHVVASSRDLEHCQATTRELTALGRRSIAIPSDVSQRETLVNLRERTLAEFGRVDILVNSAGRTKRTKTLDVDETEWAEILETNLTGTFRCCQVFGETFIAQGHGAIINIASLASFVGFVEVTAYTSSKAGVAGLTRALAVEWAPHGVRVNAIAPGLFSTSLNENILRNSDRGDELLLRTPMQRFGKIEELRGIAIFLASEASRFVTGQLIAVDGGFLASGVNH
jgi:NAD(P)-dependent dehydrogenase (short-subunit alcohol dehydrogenase family)